MISSFKSYKTVLNITLIHFDATPLYGIDNTTIGVFITIINYDLVNHFIFLDVVVFSMACVARRAHLHEKKFGPLTIFFTLISLKHGVFREY